MQPEKGTAPPGAGPGGATDDETPGAAATSALRVAHEQARAAVHAAAHFGQAVEWLHRAEVDYRHATSGPDRPDYTEALAAAKIAELHLMLADRYAAEAAHRG